MISVNEVLSMEKQIGRETVAELIKHFQQVERSETKAPRDKGREVSGDYMAGRLGAWQEAIHILQEHLHEYDTPASKYYPF